jgi:hypothetical protein
VKTSNPTDGISLLQFNSGIQKYQGNFKRSFPVEKMVDQGYMMDDCQNTSPMEEKET